MTLPWLLPCGWPPYNQHVVLHGWMVAAASSNAAIKGAQSPQQMPGILRCGPAIAPRVPCPCKKPAAAAAAAAAATHSASAVRPAATLGGHSPSSSCHRLISSSGVDPGRSGAGQQVVGAQDRTGLGPFRYACLRALGMLCCEVGRGACFLPRPWSSQPPPTTCCQDAEAPQ